MWQIEMGGVYNNGTSKFFGRKIYIEPTQMRAQRNKFNNIDVYATVMQYEDISNQNNTNLIGPMYIDLDLDFSTNDEYQKLIKDLNLIITHLEHAYGIHHRYLKLYFTGKKGFHVLIPSKIFGVKPNKILNMIYKEIAKELNEHTITKCVDTKIYDTKRLLRLPNSINSKSGKYKVPITYEQIQRFSYEDMLKYASEPQEIVSTREEPLPSEKAINKYNLYAENIVLKKERKVFIPTNVDIENITFTKCIQALYRNGALEGQRNHSTILLASAFLQKGISLQDTLHMVHKWNAERNSPSLDDSEVTITVNSAWDQIQNGRKYGCTAMKELGLCDTTCNIKS